MKTYQDMLARAIVSVMKNRSAVILALLTALLGVDYFLALFQDTAPLAAYADAISTFAREHMVFSIATLTVTFMAYTFTKATLYFAIESGRETKRVSLKANLKKGLKRFGTYFSFEISIILVAAITLKLLMLPAMLSAGNQALSDNLLLLGEIIFIPIAVLSFLIEILGSFYLLFSDTSLRASVELGYALIRKKTSPILIFGIVLLIIYALFLVASNTLLTFITTSFRGTTDSAPFVAVVVFYLLQTIFLLFSKAAWIELFHVIAKEPTDEPSLQTEENMVQENMPALKQNEGV
jgi:hypothetical protein